ncbi:MAG: 4-hydroxy-tetrahydrodipicolinate synthase, partial [Spirulinaceae cyanobacterium RM2_2_10]|nr:4-hydroxy-tetrahydrodipicolinate synthase [Spirulinaceae cyanobacterium RM2_2_10]
IAQAAPELPMMLYNVPGRTSQELAPETVARLAKIDNIVAIKDASGKLDAVSQMRTLTPADFAIYAGDDALCLPMLAIGSSGVVSVASHLVSRPLKAMLEAFFAGKVAEARDWHLRLLPLFKALFCTTNPIPVKAALQMQGWAVGSPRPPLCELSPDLRDRLTKVLQDLDLL